MITRVCVICGKSFECYPSDNKVTCSKDCRRERQRRITTGRRSGSTTYKGWTLKGPPE